MSNFLEKTIHPETGVEEEAEWLDDYYGRHLYGVRFSDGKIFQAWYVQKRKDLWPEKKIIWVEQSLSRIRDNYADFTDTDRLNWLINQSNHGKGWMSDDAWDAYGEIPENQESDDVQTGMRRAVDAAMKEEKNAAKEDSKDA